MKEGDMDARRGRTRRVRALGIAIVVAGAVAVVVWLIVDDEGLTMGDIAAPALIGGVTGLALAVVAIVLAMSRFRSFFSRIRTPSVLLLGGLGLWASILIEPTILIGLVVGLGAWLFFVIVLAVALDPWLTRRIEQQRQ
jgi:hypothetical protein